jgi:hypothetical protein
VILDIYGDSDGNHSFDLFSIVMVFISYNGSFHPNERKLLEHSASTVFRGRW